LSTNTKPTRDYPSDRTNVEEGRGPRAGIDYPRSDAEFQSWFGPDADYLEWRRWPKGFISPRCRFAGGRPTADRRFKSTLGGAKSSITAGTLFDRKRTPLTV
jgi:hypothetical protein